MFASGGNGSEKSGWPLPPLLSNEQLMCVEERSGGKKKILTPVPRQTISECYSIIYPQRAQRS